MDLRSQFARLRGGFQQCGLSIPELRHRFSGRRWLPAALMLLGVLLLAYVTSQYVGMFMEQRRLARQWQEENARALASQNAQKAPLTVVDDGLTRISIPKIELDAVVVSGTTRKQLAIAPGHLTDTATPGEDGNAVITAHRDTFFRNIYELRKGDSILIRRRGEVYKFEVTGKKVVTPDDISVLRRTNDPRLTLITCYPIYYIGPAPERLVVFSKLVERSPDLPQDSQTASSSGTP
jgi:LPXTG-site transpeptidase (sortase) family protein